MSKTIKFAVVGCGMMAAHHLNGYREIKEKDPELFEIVAMCDVDGDRAKNLANRAGEFQSVPPTYTDLEKMLKNEEIDAADVITTHSNHHVSTIACLEAGVNVVVEKPFGLTIRAGRKMLDAAERSGKILASAEPARKDVATRTIEWAINKAKLIGKPRMLFAETVRYSLGVVVGTPWRHQRIYGGGGWIIDGEVHYMDVLRYLFGDVERVYAETRNFEPTRYLDTQNIQRPVPSDVEDTAICVLTFKNGVIGRFVWTHAAIGKEIHQRIYYGSEGSIDSNGIQCKNGSTRSMNELSEQFLNTLSSDDKEKLFPRGITNAVALGIYDFLDAVRNHREPEVTGWDGFAAQAICDAIYESAHCGQAVSVDDVICSKIEAYQADINAHWGL
ncbi:Gfo/Idh/MocA family oxidoreductase [Candidatus Poribacteria bacterium]|nr:Gfo/Idh/MocA family oxidoreductase [Candidatus Poribacteria bacterium]